MITSSSNQQMKNITALMKKAKERKSQNLFVVEGRKMFEEVPPEWLSKVYVSERFLEEPEAEQLLAGKTYEVVADAVMSGAHAAVPAFRSAAREQDTSADR